MNNNVQAIVISGPSGSGKSTLLKKLFDEFKDTTRKPRPGETNGVEYHFVSREEFLKLLAEDGFLEHAEFSGNLYGTSKKSVMDISKSGLLCVLDVEVNGVKNIKKSDLHPQPKFIFIKPPSLEVLQTRLEARGTETPDSLQKRLASARAAFEYASELGTYDHIVINDNLEEAYEHLKGTIIADIHKVQCNQQKKGN